ncbi:MAG: hypothetical protein B1H11_13090 [Desulfobacteraceae bacterium 4484_190.1]|nr:MAG: hypothetical protein B1H11_13090 [Desulfobacteraceae bacterium 4484_190.1]
MAGSFSASGYKKLKSMSGFYEKPIFVLLYQLSRRSLAICILRQSLGMKKIYHALFNYFFVLHPFNPCLKFQLRSCASVDQSF